MTVGNAKHRKISRPPAFELLDQAAELFGAQQYQAADAIVARGLRLAPRNAGLWNLAAACALRMGDAVRAERAWRQAVVADPRNPLMYSNLAMLLGELSRFDEAELLCRRALQIDERLAIVHFNLGVVLGKSGRPAEAEKCYRRTLELEPRHTDAAYNLGALLAAQHRYADAERSYRQVLELNPQRIDALVNLGVMLNDMHRNGEAEACFRAALERDPGNSQALTNLGGLMTQTHRGDEAARMLAESGNVRTAIAHVNLALLQKQRGQVADAEATLHRALAAQPGSLNAQLSLGELLDEQGRSDEARRWFEQAIAQHGDSALPFGALANSCARSGDREQAERWFRAAIERPRDAAVARSVFGTWLLSEGRFEEGFLHNEARYSPEHTEPFQLPPQTDRPRWTGQDLHGRSIVIWPEQGFGDQIQFCRYAPLLKERGARHVALATHGPLIPLLSSLESVDEVLDIAEFRARRDAFDYWSYVMSLPLHCGTTLDRIPAHLPYLSASPDRLTHWAARLPPDGLRVGLVWKGSSGHRNDANRSLPGLASLAPLWQIPGVQFVSLQKGQGENEAAAPGASQPLLHLGASIRDFADSAAIVQQLDLVICVDTAIAHLAGALGKPCWVLLPAIFDWRWLRDAQTSPWYPRCVRLYRQSATGDWSLPLARVAADLAKLAATKS